MPAYVLSFTYFKIFSSRGVSPLENLVRLERKLYSFYRKSLKIPQKWFFENFSSDTRR